MHQFYLKANINRNLTIFVLLGRFFHRIPKTYTSKKNTTFFETISNNATFFIWFVELNIFVQEVLNLNELLYQELEFKFGRILNNVNFRISNIEAGPNCGFDEVYNAMKRKTCFQFLTENPSKSTTNKLYTDKSLISQGLSNGVVLYISAPELKSNPTVINIDNFYKEFNTVDKSVTLMRAYFPLIFGIMLIPKHKIPFIASLLSLIHSIDYNEFIPNELKDNIEFLSTVVSKCNEYKSLNKIELHETFIHLINSDHLSNVLNFPVKLIGPNQTEYVCLCGVGINSLYIIRAGEVIKVYNEYKFEFISKWRRSEKGLISIHVPDGRVTLLVEYDDVMHNLIKVRMKTFVKQRQST